MIIAGIQKTSLIDYPNKICTVLFTRGCNFYCGFCHNPELVIPKQFNKSINIKDIYSYLIKRKNIIDAVTITGGEPTLHNDLPNFIKKIKDLGYLVKLDTNGTNPKMLKKLIGQNQVDYVAMDIKNSLNKYPITVSNKVNINNIKKSIDIIKSSNIDYEFRTTVVPTLHTQEDMKAISDILKDVKLYIIQNFQNNKTINPKYKNIKPFTQNQIFKFKLICSKNISKVKTR